MSLSKKLGAFFAALILGLSASALGAEPTVIKMGTLAPRESPWGQVFRVWQKAVKERTGGAVELQFFWNGTQGDESGMVAKMKTGQLDGAAVTATGMSLIHKDTMVLQLPGLYPTWAKLDSVRNALSGRFEAAFKAAGFAIVGWGDVGLDHVMSKGYPVRSPADLRGKRPWVWRDDVIVPAILQSIGQVVPVPTGVPEALPELSTGNANAMSTSALAAEQLQWASRLDHINLQVVNPNVGAIVLTNARLDSLSPAHRAIVLETGKVAGKALTDRIRGEDEKALERLKKRMTVVDPSAEEKEAWAKIFKEARARLAKGTFPAELVKQCEELAAK